ncbi:MAG TPA: DinB family protein [Flavisolibacter sp.]|jgi:uncharacterized damage-inducible protein DinB|nr:DinB family protein [Flavisolibacter sp.]
MNTEILRIAEQAKDTYQGDPWFGRNMKELLSEIDERIAFDKPNDQHSILELLWHIITWKEFTITRLRDDATRKLYHFEELDWRELDHNDKSLWKKGLQRLAEVQNELVEVLQQQQDRILIEIVPERTYTFSKLLYGIVQHDIYHLGQIAYVKKMMSEQ